MKYLKSFLNYPGNKYRIIKTLLRYFPAHVNRFIDLFSGSGVVSENYNHAQHYLANDKNMKLIELQKYILRTNLRAFMHQVETIIKDYHLTNTSQWGYAHYHANSSKGLGHVNRQNYLKLRADYNSHHYSINPNVMLYTLIVYGFNNQIRFNRHGKFNNPVGKRDWNKNMRQKLLDFYKSCHAKRIKFISHDFSQINVQPYDFIYADPPYSITTAVYNDAHGWNFKDDQQLFKYLDSANQIGAEFALSNVFSSKGRINHKLIKWSKHYQVHHINLSYNNSNYHTRHGKSDECLITNYSL